MRMLIPLILLLTIIPASAVSVNVTTEKGIVGKPAKFTITVSAKNVTETVPVDVVLVMDCSGSMSRWGNIITNVTDVYLTDTFTKVGEFKLNKTSDVEVMLQTPTDTYTGEEIEVYIVNEDTGQTYPIEQTDGAVVRWYNVSPGRYAVYARLTGCCCCCCMEEEELRIFCVELPPERMTLVKTAAKDFLDMLGSNDRVALVEFTSYWDNYVDYTKVVDHLTYDRDKVKADIDSLQPLGGTPMGYGLELAMEELDQNGRSNANKVIILLSDGWNNMGPDPITVAEQIASHGYKVYTIAYGGADMDTMKRIAEITGGKFYFAANENDLKKIYDDIAKEITCAGRNAVLKVELTNVSLINATPACEISGNTLLWNLGDLNGVYNFTVTVESTKEGRIEVAKGWLNYTDPNGSFVSDEFEVYMEFVNHPPIINVTGNTDIYELQWLDLKIYVTDPDGHAVTLSYLAPIAGIFERIGTNAWELKWLPSSNFVESGTRTFTITFVAKDEYGATAKKNVTVTVHDRQKWLTIWPDKSELEVYEGNYTSDLIYVRSSSPYTVTFDVVGAKEGTYVAGIQYVSEGVVFSIMPYYTFTNDVSTVKVIFTAKNKDGLVASTSINVTVKNVNVSTYPIVAIPKDTMRVLRNGTIYVGMSVPLKVVFINATEGIVEVNGIVIWHMPVRYPIDNVSLVFVPNTAGTYRIVAYAINGNNVSRTDFIPINVSIKSVSS